MFLKNGLRADRMHRWIWISRPPATAILASEKEGESEVRMESRFAAKKLKSVQSIGLMGGGYSREGQSAASWGTSSAWDDYVNPQPPYPQESTSYNTPPQTSYPVYPPPQQYYPPSQTHGGRSQQPQSKLDRRYLRIADNYRSLEEVTEALSRAGLESSNLIVGIDFTKSNEWTGLAFMPLENVYDVESYRNVQNLTCYAGAKSYNRRSLHHIGDSLNPYEQAISIIGKTLAAFDEDNLIPCYGFGDASTHDQGIFSFYPDERFCNGFEEVLSRYREIVPHQRLAGPTSFAPVIEMAMTIVEQSGGQYHVLVIIADGQVTRSVDTEGGQLSPQERRTVEAIVQASKFPLSIILVGVGDGPWDMMKEFDDNIPARAFDNFQFVNFTEIMSKEVSHSRKETEFALAALMEIPSQYKATLELNILSGRKGNAPERVPLPPPVASSTFDNQVCPICLSNPKDMAFGCGHQGRRKARFAAEKLKSVQSIALMGAKYSREGQSAASRGTSSAWDDYVNPQPPYPQESTSYDPPPQTAYPAYAPPQQYYPPPQTHGGRSQQPQRKLDRRYSRIADNYRSLEEVTEALSRAGLESSNLIVGIDFTKSNEWTGAKSYNRRSLHHIGDSLNPYEQALSIIGKTLAAFDEDNLIPCYGFGEASTHAQEVFSFYPDERFCNGFEEVLSRYKEIVPHLRLAGPTSFAPIIEMAMTIVDQSGGQYHVLVIIADGQVTRSVDTEGGQLSPQERRTVEAIVQASKFPLSIILVGVGDGPWDMMKEFDDNIPARAFDNFQFVNFTEIMSKNMPHTRKETEFALAALMEIPSQYKATLELNILGGQQGNALERVPLPPPMYGAASSSSSKPSHAPSFPQSSPSFLRSSPSFPPSSPYSYGQDSSVGTAPPVTSSTFDNQVCPICLSNPKDMAFGPCGHRVDRFY
ncbi:hypothetical protein RHMOL_Rhmol10G0020800 [Rhododendron molle]|uniref:Uncharacterized protein n=1 Tax=Rhododendron molle TaxID=49168 RepID=A0ACC0LZ62_RHOML|nr:hypothetical protein RHMOL_Rhmol10G0020800 [Rhododendron molle]